MISVLKQDQTAISEYRIPIIWRSIWKVVIFRIVRMITLFYTSTVSGSHYCYNIPQICRYTCKFCISHRDAHYSRRCNILDLSTTRRCFYSVIDCTPAWFWLCMCCIYWLLRVGLFCRCSGILLWLVSGSVIVLFMVYLYVGLPILWVCGPAGMIFTGPTGYHIPGTVD